MYDAHFNLWFLHNFFPFTFQMHSVQRSDLSRSVWTAEPTKDLSSEPWTELTNTRWVPLLRGRSAALSGLMYHQLISSDKSKKFAGLEEARAFAQRQAFYFRRPSLPSAAARTGCCRPVFWQKLLLRTQIVDVLFFAHFYMNKCHEAAEQSSGVRYKLRGLGTDKGGK